MKLDFNLNLSQQQKLVMTQNMQLSINILQMSACELREFINKELEENPTIDDFNLNLSQQQKLVMTQNMQLSINILQMSACELREFINKELEENPTIDSDFNLKKEAELDQYKKMIESMEYDSSNYNSYSKGDYDEEGVSPLNFVSEKKTLKSYLFEQLHTNKELRNIRIIIDYMIESLDYDEEGVSPLNFVSEKKTLKSYLFEQLHTNKELRNIRIIIDYMIESLDSRGYLDETIENICSKFNISEEKCVQALEILQSLEPAGIGARNLQECLLIQLRREGKLDSNLENIINNYLELVADNKFKDIAKYLEITQLEAQNYGDIIKELEPKPSRGYYTGDEVKFITPDAYIKKIDEEYIVIMNNDVVPQLSINGAYKNLLLHGSDKEVESYIKEKIGSAMFLIKSINNRENTLKIILEDIIKRQKEYLDKGKKYLKPMMLKDIADAMFLIKSINNRENTLKIILEDIIKRQKEYLDKGKKYLKPMMLKDIAEDINMHESTVSRAIKDKYILTSYGTVKIKDLFTVGYSTKNSSNGKDVSSNGKDVSAKSIKDIIKEIIDKEDKKKPLSDEIISTELSKKNLNISRRTVAKYREEMGIKSSSKRKRI